VTLSGTSVTIISCLPTSRISRPKKAIYNQLLDHIYRNGGSIPDDKRLIANWVREDQRVWRRVRQRLIDRGKLYINGPNLRSPIADHVVEEGLKRIRDAAQAGMKSATKRADNISFLKTFGPDRR
jgi:Protein of unknown function (DUF1376)